MPSSLNQKLQALEHKISKVRKTKTPAILDGLSTIEEIMIAAQAKREHHPIYVGFSGKALINLDDECLFEALENRTIDWIIPDSPLLPPFLQECEKHFKLSEKTIRYFTEGKKIGVIILNWNGKNDTLACLKSLKQVKTPHDVIVVDNGSTDGSIAAIRHSAPHAHLIANRENLGYAEGNNVGIRHALNKRYDYIFILNNDTTVSPTILDAFLKQDAPIQGGTATLMSDPNRLDHLGGNWNPKTGTFDMVGSNAPLKDFSNPLTLDYVCGVALFVKREVFETIGLFDPRFFLFWEESDWCLRGKRAGYVSITCPNALLQHKVSASFTGGKPHITYFWWRNRLLWIDKNCPPPERKRLKKLIFQSGRRALKHLLLLSLRAPFSQKQKRAALCAQRAALADYRRGAFGPAPSWLSQK
ncbi:MAG: glycosyltransferase family 2 protein [Chlamydiia bacterium]|nr:glycosyltransferase family 2 protein [Chlamydiia bacterium]